MKRFGQEVVLYLFCALVAFCWAYLIFTFFGGQRG